MPSRSRGTLPTFEPENQMKPACWPLLAFLFSATFLSASAQLPPGDGPVTLSVTVAEPSPLKFEEALLARLAVPPGFRISVFASDLQNVRWIQPMPNGDIYVSRREQGDVMLLRDSNRDGVADEKRIAANNLQWLIAEDQNGVIYRVSYGP